MREKKQISAETMWLGLLSWLLLLALILTLPLTVNVFMNGTDAVINITPRDAVDQRVIPALWICLLGWVMVGMLSFGLVSVWQHRRELKSGESV